MHLKFVAGELIWLINVYFYVHLKTSTLKGRWRIFTPSPFGVYHKIKNEQVPRVIPFQLLKKYFSKQIELNFFVK